VVAVLAAVLAVQDTLLPTLGGDTLGSSYILCRYLRKMHVLVVSVVHGNKIS
jgi:hypothetical protein